MPTSPNWVYASGRRKAQLIPIVDHVTKLVLGWAVGERAVTELALAAWDHARRGLQDHGVCLEQVIVHHDQPAACGSGSGRGRGQDPVFTGYGWTARLLLNDRVRISYALNGARDTILAQGNPEMEAFNSRFKTENRSLLLDAQTPEQLEAVVAERMGYYNRERRHSTIGYRAPATYVACPGRTVQGDSAAMAVACPGGQARASQFRGSKTVQEMGCTPADLQGSMLGPGLPLPGRIR